METRVRVFTRNGLAYEELDNILAVRSWVLNGIGMAKFEIAKTDSKAREDVLEYGNPIVIEHDRAGIWGGIITRPRGWTDTSIQVTAVDAGEYFRRRFTPTEFSVRGTSGDVMRELIRIMNQKEDTLIREGEIHLGGESDLHRINNVMCYDALVARSALVVGEWELVPDVSTGVLNFKMNWYERAGQYRNTIPLAEGHNVERNSGVTLIEEGDIVNEARGFTKATSGSGIRVREAEDATSQSRYGLSQRLQSSQNPGQAAVAMITNMAYPRKRWSITALDVENTFDEIRLGDTIQLMMPGYGFTNQAVGSSVRVRIIGREFDDSTGKMPLTVYEVI